jgi:hypothetical protein
MEAILEIPTLNLNILAHLTSWTSESVLLSLNIWECLIFSLGLSFLWAKFVMVDQRVGFSLIGPKIHPLDVPKMEGKHTDNLFIDIFVFPISMWIIYA